jgi:hypothetical protein
MACQRQLAANRRNAAKSTGPRSAAGKKRTRRNAHTHGLSSLLSRSATIEAVEKLAREIAGTDSANDMVLAQARCAAEAGFDLGRARRAKLALVERASNFGSLKLPRFFATDHQEVQWCIMMDRWMTGGRRWRRPKRPTPEDFLATMPPSEPQRTLEAMQRVLPELQKFDRYEQRAAAQRNQAIRQIARLKQSDA